MFLGASHDAFSAADPMAVCVSVPVPHKPILAEMIHSEHKQTWACLLPAFQQTWRNAGNTAGPQAAGKSEGDSSVQGCRQDEGRQFSLLKGSRSLSPA